MPKRSNDFQNLIARIQEAMSSSPATVEESAFVRNRSNGSDEEIDVLLTFDGHGHKAFRVAIQCRDHSRKAGPGWIRELKTQRDDCGIDRLIAVHSKGFTKGAYKEADTHSIDAWSVKQAKDVDWPRIMKMPSIRIERRPFIELIELSPSPKEIEGHPINEEGVLFRNGSGERLGSPSEFAKKCFEQLSTKQAHSFQKAINRAKDRRQETVGGELDGPFDLEYQGHRYPVNFLRFRFAWMRELPVTTRFIRIEETNTLVAESVVKDDDGEIRLVIPDGRDSEKIVLSFHQPGAPPPRRFVPRRGEAELGRNDQCHCGSGKKFKKCCMGKPKQPRGLAIDMFKNCSVTLNRRRGPKGRKR